MKAMAFETATMTILPRCTVSVFSDGTVNHMWLTDPEIHAGFAILAGYGQDWKRYMREHDALHHMVADHLCQPWSYALHDGDGAVPLDQAPQRIKDEEHLVQRLQRLAMLGHTDPYGRLPAVFGPALPGFLRASIARMDEAFGPIARAGSQGVGSAT